MVRLKAMRIFSKTDTGILRSLNDDSFLHGYLEGGNIWAVVCDGIGGSSGGAVASKSAVQTVGEKIIAGFRKDMSGNSVRNLLNTAIVAANIDILDKAKSDRMLDGMGTTIVVAVICDGLVHIAHAGDSRAYILTSGGAVRLTTDHSLVQDMINCGMITEQEAMDHPRKNVITRALGIDENIDIDYCECQFVCGEKLLLCTDGLTNFISDERLYQISQSVSVESLPSALIDEANKLGGADNITAVVICE